MLFSFKDFCASKSQILNLLMAVYGVGRTTGLLLCKRFGIAPQAIAKNIGEDRLYAIRQFLEDQVLIADDVRKVEIDTMRRYTSNNSIKGRRIKKGLPIRGQRSRTNAQTPKKRRAYFEQLLK